MIVGNYVRLRIMDSTDAEWVRTLRNSPEVMRFFQYRQFINDLQQRKYVESLATSESKRIFIAEEIAEGRPFGVLQLNNIDYLNQRAESGIFLNELGRSLGLLAFESAYLLYDFGFNTLNLRKIVSEVLVENEKARHLNRGLGVIEEGVRREHVFYDGGFHDVLLYALFRDEFYGNPTPAVRHFHLSRKSTAPNGAPPSKP